jgi:hypothetical protein
VSEASDASSILDRIAQGLCELGDYEPKETIGSVCKGIYALGPGDWEHKIPEPGKTIPMARVDLRCPHLIAWRIEIGLGYVYGIFDSPGHLDQGSLHILFGHDGAPLDFMRWSRGWKHERSPDQTAKDFLRAGVQSHQPKVLAWLRKQSHKQQWVAMNRMRVDMANLRRERRLARHCRLHGWTIVPNPEANQ